MPKLALSSVNSCQNCIRRRHEDWSDGQGFATEGKGLLRTGVGKSLDFARGNT